MRYFILAALLSLVGPFVAASPLNVNCVPLLSVSQQKAPVEDVRLINHRFDIRQDNGQERRYLILTFDVSAKSQPGQSVDKMEFQSSSKDEYYFYAHASPRENTESLVRFHFEIFVDERPIVADPLWPWPVPTTEPDVERLLQLKFDAGFKDGVNQWKAYSLDVTDWNNPVFSAKPSEAP